MTFTAVSNAPQQEDPAIAAEPAQEGGEIRLQPTIEELTEDLQVAKRELAELRLIHQGAADEEKWFEDTDPFAVDEEEASQSEAVKTEYMTIDVKVQIPWRAPSKPLDGSHREGKGGGFF